MNFIDIVDITISDHKCDLCDVISMDKICLTGFIIMNKLLCLLSINIYSVQWL